MTELLTFVDKHAEGLAVWSLLFVMVLGFIVSGIADLFKWKARPKR